MACFGHVSEYFIIFNWRFCLFLLRCCWAMKHFKMGKRFRLTVCLHVIILSSLCSNSSLIWLYTLCMKLVLNYCLNCYWFVIYEALLSQAVHTFQECVCFGSIHINIYANYQVSVSSQSSVVSWNLRQAVGVNQFAWCHRMKRMAVCCSGICTMAMENENIA